MLSRLNPFQSRPTSFLWRPFARTVTSLGKAKGRLVILGSGWAGFKLLRNIDFKQYDVICVSPRNHFVFTPLLASAAVGTLEFRAIVEPVRQYRQPMQYFQATCDRIDLQRQVIECTSTLDPHTFSLKYDHLVIATGAKPHTFNIEGVEEHAFFLKEVKDAKNIRRRVIECFERAMEPGISESEQLRLLHFQTVGGGPTGVEFSAELHDLICEDLAPLYPTLMNKVQMTLYDVAPRILGSFDHHLATYATQRFQRRGVHVKTGSKVEKVTSEAVLVNGEWVPFGLLVWATGLTQLPLIRSLGDHLQVCPKNTHRLMTDGWLRVLNKQENMCLPNVYALGDCAMIHDHDLPSTAQVANQKAIFLAKRLNNPDFTIPFTYKHRGSMAYVGGWRAVVDLPKENYKVAGYLAWIFWRSVYLGKSVSWRNKFMIPWLWFMTWAFGRDVCKID